LKYFYNSTPNNLLKEYYNELDGVLDFKMQELIKQYALSIGYKDNVRKDIELHYRNFPNDYYLPVFLDNHDMDRFLFSCGNKIDVLKKGAKIQFMQDQPPIIYYGTEVGLSQKKSIWDFSVNGDLQARQPMEWKNQNNNLLNFYKNLILEKKMSK
jgi:glycosidase